MTEPTTAPATGSGTPGGTPAPVSLREFARLVPMPYSTAREWTLPTRRRPAPLIRAGTTATGRRLVTLDQLPRVRAAYFGTDVAAEQRVYDSRTPAPGTPAPAPEVAP